MALFENFGSIIEGVRQGQQDIRTQETHEMTQAINAMNLQIKSAEYDDYIAERTMRRKQQQVKELEAERAIELEPLKKEQEKERIETDIDKAQWEQDRIEAEQYAEVLYGLNQENYGSLYADLPRGLVNQLELTGDWTQDAATIDFARKHGIYNIDHIRKMQEVSHKETAKNLRKKDIKYKDSKLTPTIMKAVVGMSQDEMNSLEGNKKRPGEKAKYASAVATAANDLMSKWNYMHNRGVPGYERPMGLEEAVAAVKVVAMKHISKESLGLGGLPLVGGVFDAMDDDTFDMDSFKAEMDKELADLRIAVNRESAAATEGKPPVAGAKKAPNGKWYVPDPKRPGKYLEVK